MNIDCPWLTPEKSIELEKYSEEINTAYNYFLEDFFDTIPPMVNGFPVKCRYYPLSKNGKPLVFNHITTRDYDKKQGNSNNDEDRLPDIKRIERIKWIKKIIEHPFCKPNSKCNNCHGIYTWYEPYNNTYRMNFLLYDEYYMVVLEKNKKYNIYFLITAFYLINDMERDMKHKKYKKYKNYLPDNL